MPRTRTRRHAFASLLADERVMEEVRKELIEKQPLAAGGPPVEEGLESLIEHGPSEGAEFTQLEAIILLTGRPALLVQQGKFAEPRLKELRDRVEPHRESLERAIPSVGRVELANHPRLDYVGTAWVVDERVLLTNRHVAHFFSEARDGVIRFRRNPSDDPYEVCVDFLAEYENPKEFEVRVVEVVHMEPEGAGYPDMAIIRLADHAGLPAPLPLAPGPVQFQEDVAVIGYPAFDPRNDVFAQSDIFDDIYDVKRLAPGRISGVRPDGALVTHDCSTLGGNSGSCVLRVETGEVVGLHFAGSFRENNYAVPSARLLSRLSALGATTVSAGRIAVVDPASEESKITAEELADRKGYDEEFLREKVSHPTLSDELAGVRTEVEGREDGLLQYTHYSVMMRSDRNLAIYTACNIDGSRAFRPVRTDDWRFDPRIPREFQHGNELYGGNRKMHRGHLVRRLDPAWGDSMAAARAAAHDTFFFTNCSPQLSRFNPRSWLELEDYVLGNAVNDDMRLTVFTGPIYTDRDRLYREVPIPQEYWKVLAFWNTARSEISATAYRLSQADFLGDLEFVFGEFQTFQVRVAEIQEATGLTFGDLASRDPLGRVEAAEARYLIEGRADLIL